MRKLLLILILLFFMMLIYADTENQLIKETDTYQRLVIKGYKVAKSGEGAEVAITDALTGNLDIISDKGDIDISDKVGDLRGNLSYGAGVFSEQIIFSYRVVGYELGNFTLDISATPFTLKKSDEETKIDDEPIVVNDYIDSRWELGNLSYSFPDFSSDVGYGNDKISEISTINSDQSSGSTDGITLQSKWSVTDGNADNSVSRWIHRGAVALTIDETTYMSAAVGNYASIVKVTLTSD